MFGRRPGALYAWAGTLALALGCLATPTASQAATCGSSGTWSYVKTPHFPIPVGEGEPSGVYELPSAYAADPGDAGYLVAISPDDVMASWDGGCSWRLVMQLSTLPSAAFPFTYNDSTFDSVSVATDHGRRYAYLTVAPLVSPGVVHVLVSSDGGRHWKLSDPIPPALDDGWNHAVIHAAPGHGSVVYLLVHTGVAVPQGTRSFWRSTDAGTTWSRQSSRSDLGQQPGSWDFAIDPLRPSELWEWNSEYADQRVSHSLDGGATWTTLPFSVDPLNSSGQYVALLHRPGHGRTVVFVVRDNHLYLSHNDGASWSHLPAPPGEAWRSVGGAFGMTADQIIVGTIVCPPPKRDCIGQVWRFRGKHGNRSWVNVTPSAHSADWAGFTRTTEHGRVVEMWGMNDGLEEFRGFR